MEIDSSLPFTHQFEIESPFSADPIVIEVEYEWKPLRCERCNLFSHVCLGLTDKIPRNMTSLENTPSIDADNITKKDRHTNTAGKHKSVVTTPTIPSFQPFGNDTHHPAKQTDSRKDQLP